MNLYQVSELGYEGVNMFSRSFLLERNQLWLQPCLWKLI